MTVFPELTLTGYPPLDLLEREDFVKANLSALKKLASFKIKTAIVVGCVDFNPSTKEREGAAELRGAHRGGKNTRAKGQVAAAHLRYFRRSALF